MMPMAVCVPRMSSAWKSLYHFLLAISLAGFSTSGQKPCQTESIQLLGTLILRLGNSSDATLYTPEETIACYADNLSCFSTELQVIQKEHDEHAKILAQLQSRLEGLTKKLRWHSAARRYARCPPCEAHPLQPVPVFLNRLLELLQRKCRIRPTQELVLCSTPTP